MRRDAKVSLFFALTKAYDFQPATLHPATQREDDFGKFCWKADTKSAGICI